MTNPFESIECKLDKIQAEIAELKARPEPKPEPEERYVSAEYVCELFDISRTSLWSWDKKGLTTPYRLGNLKRYRLSEILALGEPKTKNHKS